MITMGGVKECPFCGAPMNWRELVRPPWERRAQAEGWTRFSAFDAGTVGSALQAGATYEKRRPIRPARMESDVMVPLAQSVITGIAGGVVAGSVAALRGAGWWSLLWAAAGGAATWGASWMVLLNTTRSLMWEVERIVGRDLDGDGDVGEPVGQREPIRVESLERDARDRVKRIRYVTLPVGVTDDDLARIAQAALVDELPFSRRGLAEVISPDKYTGISRAMLEGGLLSFSNGRNNANGVVLTGAGRAFLRQYVPEVVVAGGGR